MNEQSITETRAAAEPRQMSQDLFGAFVSYRRALIDAARRYEEGSRNYLAIAALNESLRLIEEWAGLLVRAAFASNHMAARTPPCPCVWRSVALSCAPRRTGGTDDCRHPANVPSRPLSGIQMRICVAKAP